LEMAENSRSLEGLAQAHVRMSNLVHREDFLFGDCRIGVQANSATLIGRLADYFEPYRGASCSSDLTVIAFQTTPPDFRLPFIQWPREEGKTRPKEEYADVGGGRIVRKVRTGMQFLIGRNLRVSLGPCLENINQVINFVIAQYITWLMHRGWVLCHAAGVALGGKGLGIAAVSGGGKSTLALHLLGRGLAFVSNDRLLVKGAQVTHMNGVPKMPRINPGTALNNPSLVGLLPKGRRDELSGLESNELWDLEEKYDVNVHRVFKDASHELQACLDAFVLLNWKRDSREPSRFRDADLSVRRDLIKLIMKPPGPFYQLPDGAVPASPVQLPESEYLRHLGSLRVVEVTGGVDFDAASSFCVQLLRDVQDGFGGTPI
jgi:HprK-related kinase B